MTQSNPKEETTIIHIHKRKKMGTGVIAFDIETVGLSIPIEEEMEARPDVFAVDESEIVPPKNYKSEEAIAGYIQRTRLKRVEEREKRIEEMRSEYALDPATGRVACVSLYGTDAKGEEIAVSFIHNDEVKLLTEFWHTLKAISARGPMRLVGFNSKSFDVPFLHIRSAVHDIRPAYRIDQRRYYSDYHCDLRDILTNFDNRKKGKLNYYAKLFGVQQKSGSGSMVDGWWKNGEHEKIASYCLDDCRATYQVFNKVEFMT